MRPFQITSPDSVPAAAATEATGADSPDAMFIAGGTTMVDLMKYHVFTPKRLVDVRRLRLDAVELRGDTLHIGSGATMTDVAYHADVTRDFPGIRDGLLLAASQGLRNVATMGGNIMQRTRCPYYRDPSFACNRRNPGSGCAAMEGWTRYNAVLGVSDQCIAAHFSDVSNVLAALEATVVVEGPAGGRRIALTDFHLRPGDTPEREHALRTGELITAIEVQKGACAKTSNYVKIRDRNSYAFAIASAAAGLDVSGGRIREAKCAIGAVGTVPWKVPAVEKYLVGKRATPEVFAKAAERATDGAVTREHNAYKVPLAQRALVEALTKSAALAA